MDFMEAAEFFARFVWPLVLAWNIFLYRSSNKNKEALNAFQLEVAKDYASKKDLEKLFSDFETRFNKQIEQLISLQRK
jgi:hypothetical protein